MSIVRHPGIRNGFPCFEGTRIPFDVVLQIVDHETIHPEDVGDYYPPLTAADYHDAVAFYADEATPAEREGKIA